MVILVRMIRRSAILRQDAARPAVSGLAAYVRQFWASLLFALSELLVLNSPYAVLTALFGVGPVLVVFDSVMKVCRLAMAGSRTLAEIFLPRISRQLLAGDVARAHRGLWQVTALCVGATAIPAGAVLFFAPWLFNLLLGPNNVVPPEAAPAAALIVLVSGFYQPATFFLSYLNARRLILNVTRFACLAALVAAAPSCCCASGSRSVCCGSMPASSVRSRSMRCSSARGSSPGTRQSLPDRPVRGAGRQTLLSRQPSAASRV